MSHTGVVLAPPADRPLQRQEPLGGVEPERPRQVHPAVADVRVGRAAARVHPVDHAAHGAVGPQDVARVVVAVDEAAAVRGAGAAARPRKAASARSQTSGAPRP